MICQKCQQEMTIVHKFWMCGNCGQTIPVEPETSHGRLSEQFSINLNELPSFLAIVLGEYLREQHPVMRLHRLCDAVEVLTRFLMICGLAELRRAQGDKRLPEKLLKHLQPGIERPTLSQWVTMINAVVEELEGQEHLLLPELPEVVRDHLLPLLGSSGGEAEESLIRLRNDLAHGGAITRAAANKFLDIYEPRFSELWRNVAFLTDTRVVYNGESGVGALLGSVTTLSSYQPTPEIKAQLNVLRGHIFLVHSGEVLNLWPLCDYGKAVSHSPTRSREADAESPLVYYRSDIDRLLYAALGAELPVGENRDALEEFRALFQLEDQLPVEKKEKSLSFEDEIRRNVDELVGRKAEIETAKTVIKATQSGVLWITGPGGIGKSMLMAKLAVDFGNTPKKQGCRIIHRFKAGDTRCSKETFLRLAIVQIAAWLEEESRPKDDPLELERQFDGLLEQVAKLEAPDPRGKPPRVLLFIDGLDEIVRYDPGFAEFPFRKSYANVVWVCAGRAESGLPDVFREDRCTLVFGAEGMPKMTDNDIRGMLLDGSGSLKYDLLKRDKEQLDEQVIFKLTEPSFEKLQNEGIPEEILQGLYPLKNQPITEKQKFLDAVKEQIGEAQIVSYQAFILKYADKIEVVNQFVEEVVQKADGLPLYVHFVIEDILSGDVRFDDEKNLPSGLIAYYNVLLSRLGVGDLQPVLTPLVVSIAWAKEPLCQEVLKTILIRRKVLKDNEKGDHLLRTALLQAQSMLKAAPTYEGLTGYTIYHDTFRRHIQTAESLEHQNELAWEEYANFVLDWQQLPSGSSRLYALRFGAEHLLEVQRYDDLFALARDKTFQQTQKQAFPTEPHLPLRTLQTALQGAIEQDDAVRMAEFLLAHAYQAIEIKQETPLDALRNGDLQRAWELADLYDSAARVRLYLLLAWELYDTDRRSEAQATLQRQSLPCIDFFDEAEAWVFAGLYAHSPDEILTLSRKVVKNFGFYAQVCRWLIAWCKPDLAQQLVGQITIQPQHVEAVTMVVEALSRSGAFAAAQAILAAAQATVQTIADAGERARALCTIAVAQAQIGDFPAAQTTAQTIVYKEERVKALGKIAVAQAQAGAQKEAQATFATAQEIAQAIFNKTQHAWALHVIAVAQAQCGDIVAAQATTQTIADGYWRAEALCEIAAAQVQAEARDDARTTLAAAQATAQGISDGRSSALHNIVVAQARVGDFAAAQATAQEIADEFGCKNALQAIAVAQAQAGDVVAAHTTAQGIADEFWREDALQAIAVAQAQAGDVVAAHTTAQGIANKWNHTLVLRDIAAAQTQAGDIAGAQATTQTIADGYGYVRAQALREIAAVQAQSGAQDNARAILAAAQTTEQTIADENVRAEALYDIAAVQTQFGDFTAAQATTQTIVDGYWRAEALRAIVVAQAQANDFATAQATAQEIADENVRAKALYDIAAAQARVGDFVAAQMTAQGIANTLQRVKALGAIATVQVHVGAQDDARKTFAAAQATAQEIVDENVRAEALAEIAAAQTQAGEFAAAQATAQTIANEWQLAEVLHDIAVAQAQSGEFAAAQATTQTIIDEKKRAKALGAIASAHVQAGMWKEAQSTFASALATAQEMSWEFLESDRVEALRDIAVAQAQVGSWKEAHDTIAAAQVTAQGIADEWLRSMALYAIAVAQVQVGEFAAAQATTQGIADEWPRLMALCDIAVAQAKAGLVDEALQTAALILRKHNVCLPGIADAFVETGDKDHFKRLLLPCAEYLDAAYAMCGKLARLYPAQAAAIAEIVRQGSPSQK